MSGRPCSICSDTARWEIDTALLQNLVLREVAVRFSKSETSLRRHLQNHVPIELRTRALQSGEPTPGDFVTRLAELAESATAVRLRALQTGDTLGVLRAVREESAVLTMLMTKLGINTDNSAKFYDEATTIARALGDAVRASPEALDAIVSALEAREAHDLAEGLKTASRQTKKVAAI